MVSSFFASPPFLRPVQDHKFFKVVKGADLGSHSSLIHHEFRTSFYLIYVLVLSAFLLFLHMTWDDISRICLNAA